MRILLTLYCFLYTLPGHKQQINNRLPPNSVSTLVAKNNKHTIRYENGDVLKIYYRDSNSIVKAKGRLFIYDSSHVQLVPFGRKEIITINTNVIFSTGQWRRRGKITAAVVGGTGLVAISLAAAMQQPYRPGIVDGNFIQFGLLIYAVAILWYEIIAVPSIFLTEQLSIRSEKKRYHFYIETTRAGEPNHLRHSFIRWY